MNNQLYYEEQIKELKKVFKEYDIPEFEKDLKKNPNNDYVRWVYTFWAQRFNEGNTSATLTILRSMNQ